MATRKTTPAANATFCSMPMTTLASGATRASTGATCSRSRTSTICRSTASRQASSARCWAAGRLQGSTFMRTGTPLWVTESADIAGTGDALGSSLDPQWRSEGERQREVLGWQRPRRQLLVRQDRVLAAGRRHFRHEQSPGQHLQPGPVSVGHRAVQERQCRWNPELPVPGGDLQLPEPCELERRRGRIRRTRSSAASPARTALAGTSS